MQLPPPHLSPELHAPPDPDLLTNQIKPPAGIGSGSAPREPSPPRSRKSLAPGADRKYSWATQRITELQNELLEAQGRIKELKAVLRARQAEVERAERAEVRGEGRRCCW
jgi:hypothetical protein